MDYQTIANIITTVGFPIVAAVALFWYVNKQQDSHAQEIKALQDSLNQNTTVLAELKELITWVVTELKNDKGN